MELILEYTPLLDRGLTRERNEDRCGVFVPEDPLLRRERGYLFIVADGMGGHAAGDVAAELTVQTVKETYFLGDGWSGPEEQLRAAFLAANQAILLAAREGGRQGMGAAAVVAAVVGNRVFVAHLGDCRGYLVRGAGLAQLTSDHTWVQERIDAGRLTTDEARIHPYRSVLTRALGAETDAEPDVRETSLWPGDVMLLCSDGLWGVTSGEELIQTLGSASDTESAAQALVDLALARGGPDNISVIVVRVLSPAGDNAPTVKLPLRGE